MAESVNVQIVSAVAAELETDPLDLPPLNDAVDIEALEALFETCEDADCDLQFRFGYVGHEVTVSGDGVSLDESTDDPPPAKD